MNRYEVLWLYNGSHVMQTLPFMAKDENEVANKIDSGEIQKPKYPPVNGWEIRVKPEYLVRA